MSGKTESTYEKARELAEAALDEYAKGNAKKGDKLADDAVQTDHKAVEDVVRDIDEDCQTTGKE
jgi:hypothetical protein